MNKKVLPIGGGTGLATLLRGIKHIKGIDIVCIVTMMDDGGSSGRLRKEFGVVPPGDIRNCLLALSEKEDLLSKLFSYRFPVKGDKPEVGGHSLGNLLLIAMSDIFGGIQKAVSATSEILSIKGKVLPVTLQTANLVAQLENGEIVKGESKISQSSSQIKKLKIVPRQVKHYPEVEKNILDSDMIIIGPGSLFTSLIPPLMFDGIVDSIKKSKAKKVFICNIMTQPGETNNYTVSMHIDKIYEHCKYKFEFDYIIVNTGKIPLNLLNHYVRQNSFPVKVDYDKLKKFKSKIIYGNFVPQQRVGKYLRHDSEKITKKIRELL
ncbi:MAG: uridine diphosphate-N-acetylglucosamine-binding protein YvcK [Endomicrobiia bacterium]